ncbi:lysophospholipase [Bacteriovoracaceae bacterium]|nr:lysophospholipase [Bacteriovoracaceae bacterium]
MAIVGSKLNKLNNIYLEKWFVLIIIFFKICLIPVYAKLRVNLPEQYTQMKDGEKLRYEFLSGEVKKPVIILIHGQNEHYGMYNEFTKSARTAGFDILRFDMVGQGKSTGRRCYIPSYNQYDSHLEQLISQLKERGHTKIHIVAHSTGSFIALYYLASRKNKETNVNRVVVSAPFLGLGGGFVNKHLAGNVAQFLTKIDFLSRSRVPEVRNYQFTNNGLTHDPKIFREIYTPQAKEFALKCGSPTWNWLAEISKAQKTFKGLGHRIKNPLMIIKAGKDTVVDNDLIDEFYSTVKDNNEKNKIITMKDNYHSNYMELNRFESYKLTLEYLR